MRDFVQLIDVHFSVVNMLFGVSPSCGCGQICSVFCGKLGVSILDPSVVLFFKCAIGMCSRKNLWYMVDSFFSFFFFFPSLFSICLLLWFIKFLLTIAVSACHLTPSLFRPCCVYLICEVKEVTFFKQISRKRQHWWHLGQFLVY